MVASKPAILLVVEQFYGGVNVSHASRPGPKNESHISTLAIHPSAEMSLRSRQHVCPSKNQQTRPIRMHQRMRQGDVIFPKLFSNAIEDLFKSLHWKGRGINFISKYTCDLRTKSSSWQRRCRIYNRY